MATVGILGASSVLPRRILVGPRYVEISDVAVRAFADSELKAVDWNALEPEDRDLRIVSSAHALITEASTIYDG